MESVELSQNIINKRLASKRYYYKRYTDENVALLYKLACDRRPCRNEYHKIYYANRYNTDPEFKERHRLSNKKYRDSKKNINPTLCINLIE